MPDVAGVSRVTYVRAMTPVDDSAAPSELRSPHPAAGGAGPRGTAVRHGEEAVSGGSGGRTFWWTLAGLWSGYALLVATAFVAERATLGGSVWHAVFGTLVSVIPLAVLSVPVALRRRELFRPDRSLGRMIGLQLLVASLYAIGAAVTVTVLVYLTSSIWPPEMNERPWTMVSLRVVSGMLHYGILAGFLMWTESVRRYQEGRALAAHEAMLRSQAELRALRAQFNPHFVFNTLHSMLVLVRADPAAAERAIEDVAGLIRYASRLERQQVDVVPLAQEIEFAERYLALERLRLAERLRVEWDVDDATRAVGVPAFSLQTLLENAIKHSVSRTKAGALVRVGARVDDRGLVVDVSDDGPGADPARVEASRGHGLRLLAQRTRALYGEDASLVWASAPGAGFRVTLSLPATAVPAPLDAASVFGLPRAAPEPAPG